MDDLSQSLRDAKPSWMTDGHGIKGPSPTLRSPSSDTVRRSDFPAGSVERQATAGDESTPATPQELTITTVSGANEQGIPSTLDVYSRGGWRPLPPPEDPAP